MNPSADTRFYIYVAAGALSVVVGGLVLFGVVDADKVPLAVGALSAVYLGVSALAAKNVPRQ